MIQEPLAEHLGVYTGSGDSRTSADHDDRRKSEEHSGAQFRNLKYVGEGADHLKLVAAALGCCLNFREDNFAPGFLDFLASRGANLVHFDRQSLGHFAATEDFDSIEASFDETCFAKGFFGDRVTSRERLFQGVQIDNAVESLEGLVIETTLWQLAVDRHLTTFKAKTNGAAGACFLTLVTFAGSFALAGAFADTKAFTAVLCTGIGFKCMKSHLIYAEADSVGAASTFGRMALPRMRKTSSLRRSWLRAAIVA